MLQSPVTGEYRLTGTMHIDSITPFEVYGHWDVEGYTRLFARTDSPIGLVDHAHGRLIISATTPTGIQANHRVRRVEENLDCYEVRFGQHGERVTAA